MFTRAETLDVAEISPERARRPPRMPTTNPVKKKGKNSFRPDSDPRVPRRHSPEELGLDVLLPLVPLQHLPRPAREAAQRAPELVVVVGGRGGRRRRRRGGGVVHHLGVSQQLLEVLGGVQAVRALVDPHALLVHIPQVVEVVARVLREEVARAARVVALHFALGEVLRVLVLVLVVEVLGHLQQGVRLNGDVLALLRRLDPLPSLFTCMTWQRERVNKRHRRLRHAHN